MAGITLHAAKHPHRRRPTLSMVYAVAIFVAAATLTSAPAEPAGALCDQGRPFVFLDYFGREDPRAGTCDGDSIYRGTVKDIRTDGTCVFVEFADYGQSFIMAHACTAAGTPFTFTDITGDSAAFERLCMVNRRDCSVWWPNTRF